MRNKKRHHFNALHGMRTRSYDENSVRPSVCPSVKRVHCDKTKDKSVQIFTALHGMQTRSYDEISVRLSVRLSVCLSVRLSVCLSVKRVHCDKTEERYV